MAHYYSKIQAPFKRLEGSSTVNTSMFIDEYVSMLKDIYWDGIEKIDGTNCNILYDGNNVSYLGHTDKTSWNPEVENWINENFVNNDTFVQMCEQHFGEKTVYFHGELIGPKIQSNLYNLDDYKFIVFDIRINNTYLNYLDVVNIAITFGLDFAKCITSGNLNNCTEYIRRRNHRSMVYDKREIEGIVIRPPQELLKRNGERIIYKIKVKDITGCSPITFNDKENK